MQNSLEEVNGLFLEKLMDINQNVPEVSRLSLKLVDVTGHCNVIPTSVILFYAWNVS